MRDCSSQERHAETETAPTKMQTAVKANSRTTNRQCGRGLELKDRLLTHNLFKFHKHNLDV